LLFLSSAYAGTAYRTTVDGFIGKRIWYNPKSSCVKIDDTEKLVWILKTEAKELGYSNCIIKEASDKDGHILLRTCDRGLGDYLVVSPLTYCESRFRKKEIKFIYR